MRVLPFLGCNDCQGTSHRYIHDRPLRQKKFVFQIMYNAEGEILRPFVTHKGDIPQAVIQCFKNDFCFIKTEDGEINANLLLEVRDEIHR